MDNGFGAVLGVFAFLAIGALVLVGLDMLIEGHLPFVQLALGGGLVVLTIGAALNS